MIAEFKVRNFYSIRSEQKISFVPDNEDAADDEYCVEAGEGVRLLKIGIIYGANASGKSYTLEAFSFFVTLVTGMPKDKSEMLGFMPFLFDDHSENEKSEMCATFYLEGQKYVLRVEFDRSRIYEETLTLFASKRPSTLYKRTYNEDTQSTVVTFGKTLRLPKLNQNAIIGNTINNCTVLAAFGRSNVKYTHLNRVYEFFSASMPEILSPRHTLNYFTHRMLKKDSKGELKGFLKKLLKASDFNISDFSYLYEEHALTAEERQDIASSGYPQAVKDRLLKEGKRATDEITFVHQTKEGSFELAEHCESAGTMRFMGVGTLLHEIITKKAFVQIDEVETSLHYELVAYFIKCFLANSDNGSQLLLATHDINLLHECFIRRDVVWFTEKDECGETHIKRLSEMGLHRNLSPYNAYKQGKLVSLPFLDSPYF